MVTLSEFVDGRGFLISCPPQIDVRDFYEAKKALEERFPNLNSWYFGIVDMSLVSEMTVAAWISPVTGPVSDRSLPLACASDDGSWHWRLSAAPGCPAGQAA